MHPLQNLRYRNFSCTRGFNGTKIISSKLEPGFSLQPHALMIVHGNELILVQLQIKQHDLFVTLGSSAFGRSLRTCATVNWTFKSCFKAHIIEYVSDK